MSAFSVMSMTSQLLATAVSDAAIATPGNILVGVGRELKEYTPDGQFVRSIEPIPYPDSSIRAVYDSVFDDQGRLHVLTDKFFATLSPTDLAWTFIPATFFGTYAAANDLSVRGNLIWSSNHYFDPDALTRTGFTLPGGEWSEVEIGPDGMIYAINGGNPRYRMRTVDPTDFSLIKEILLRDGDGRRLTVGALAFLDNGDFYAASENSVHLFSANGQHVKGITIDSQWFYDLDLLADGSLAGGNRSGELILLDAELSSYKKVKVGGTQVYVGMVPAPKPDPPLIVATHVDPGTLWPPNGKMVQVQASADVEGGTGELELKIVKIEVDEPHSPSDYQILNDHTVALRAARRGYGSGRTYTLYLKVTDEAGLESEEAAATVFVPHDQGKKPK